MKYLIVIIVSLFITINSCKEPKVAENSKSQFADSSNSVNVFRTEHKFLSLYRVRDDNGYVLDNGYFLNGSKSLPGGYYFEFDHSMELRELNHEVFLVNRCSLDSNQILIVIDFPHRDVDSIKFGLSEDFRKCRKLSLQHESWCSPRLFIKVKKPDKIKDIFIKFRVRLNKNSIKHRKNLLELPFFIDYSFVETFCFIQTSPNDSVLPCDLVDIELLSEASLNQIIQIQ